MATTQEQAPTVATKASPADSAGHDHHAWIVAIANPYAMLIFAAFTGVFWWIATQMTINTSEVWYLGVGYSMVLPANQVTLMPHFSILSQFGDLFSGVSTSAQQSALLYAWFQEAMTIVFSVGGVSYALQVVQSKVNVPVSSSVAKNSKLRDRIFNAGIWLMFGWDAYTDYMYGSGSSIAHISFTIVQGLVSFFFLPICIICLRATFAMWFSAKK